MFSTSFDDQVKVLTPAFPNGEGKSEDKKSIGG